MEGSQSPNNGELPMDDMARQFTANKDPTISDINWLKDQLEMCWKQIEAINRQEDHEANQLMLPYLYERVTRITSHLDHMRYN